MSAKATSLVAPVATMTEPPSPSPSTHVLSLHRRRSASFWEGDAFVSLVALFIWPVGMVLVTSTGLLKAYLLGLVRALLHFLQRRRRERLSRQQGQQHCVTEEEPEMGLYWYGLGNVSEKEGEGGESRYFDPSKPSVIYVHGYQPHTIARRFRESLNWKENDLDFGLDIDAADHWIEAGWNVGVWYWNQYADEDAVHFAEAKIWTNRSPVHMRYRKLLPTAASEESAGTPASTRTAYGYVDSSVPCVSEQLAQTLEQRFSQGTAPYRLAGHSLGTQVVIHASTLLAQRAKERPSIRLPTRLALLDPFFTPELKPYLGWRTIASVLHDEAHELSTREHIVLEQYQTSLIGNNASKLSAVTAFFHLTPPHIPWWRLRSRHVSAPYLYFLSFADEFATPIRQVTWNRVLETTASLYDPDEVLPGNLSDDLRALAKAPDEALRLLMHATPWDEMWGIFGTLDQ